MNEYKLVASKGVEPLFPGPFPGKLPLLQLAHKVINPCVILSSISYLFILTGCQIKVSTISIIHLFTFECVDDEGFEP